MADYKIADDIVRVLRTYVAQAPMKGGEWRAVAAIEDALSKPDEGLYHLSDEVRRSILEILGRTTIPFSEWPLAGSISQALQIPAKPKEG